RLRTTAVLRQAPRLVHAALLSSWPAPPEFAPNRWSLVAAHEGSVVTLDIRSGRRTEAKVNLPRAWNQFATSRDGRYASWLVVRGDAGSGRFASEVRVRDLAAGRPAGPPLRAAALIRGYQLGPDGARVVAWDEGHEVRVWETSQGREMKLPLPTGHRLGR